MLNTRIPASKSRLLTKLLMTFLIFPMCLLPALGLAQEKPEVKELTKAAELKAPTLARAKIHFFLNDDKSEASNLMISIKIGDKLKAYKGLPAGKDTSLQPRIPHTFEFIIFGKTTAFEKIRKHGTLEFQWISDNNDDTMQGKFELWLLPTKGDVLMFTKDIVINNKNDIITVDLSGFKPMSF